MAAAPGARFFRHERLRRADRRAACGRSAVAAMRAGPWSPGGTRDRRARTSAPLPRVQLSCDENLPPRLARALTEAGNGVARCGRTCSPVDRASQLVQPALAANDSHLRTCTDRRPSAHASSCYVCYPRPSGCSMPRTVPHREPRNDSGRILREVQTGATIAVTNRGEVIALLVPPPAHPRDTLRVRAARVGGRVQPAAACNPPGLEL